MEESKLKKEQEVEFLVDEMIDVEKEKSCYLREFESKFKNEKELSDLKVLADKYRSDEIDDVLIHSETSDDGGVIAMTGFYYQLLITTKYVLEMLEGKWDKVVVDHHQDIIVYNNEKIRFIQVKTKKTANDNCLVSETNAYNEWIPKLFVNQKLFDNSNLKLEFELVSNCTFLNAPRKCREFETFYKNLQFENGDIDGDLYDCLIDKKELYDLTEPEIKKGLRSFKVTKFSGENIIDTLYLNIGKQFSKFVRANDEIINMFVSFLFEKCYFPENVSIQIINNESLQQLMTSIGLKIQSTAEQEMIANSSDEIVGNFIDRLKELFSKAPVYDELLKFIDEFEQELGGFFKKNEIDSISTILGRYLKKQKHGTDFRISKSDKMNEEAKKMFKVMVLIKFYFGEKLEIDTTSNRLLILSSQETQFNLYGIEEELFWNINDAITNFKDTFYDLDLEEKLKIIKNPYFRIILSGTYDNEVDFESEFIEVSCKEKAKLEQLSAIKEFEEKDTNESIAYVKNKLFFTDAEDSKFDKILKKMKSYNQLQDIRDKLSEEFKI